MGLITADSIEISTDAILDRWARHVRAGAVGRTRRGLGSRRARENMRPLLIAVAAAAADAAALAEFQPGRPAYLEARHFGELRQQQGFKIRDVIEEFRHLRREIVAQVVDASPVSSGLVEMIQRIDDAVDRAGAVAVETFHSVEVETLAELVTLDSLTGVHNYGYLWDRLEQEVLRARRHGHPLSVVMLDIDWFKRYNDEFGHLWGDLALKEIASIMQGITRRSDVVARYGGDEFFLILPETPIEGACAIADRARAEVSEHRFRFKTDSAAGLTVSAGSAWMTDGETGARELVGRADGALYEAKRMGKNRVVVFADGMTCQVP